MTTYKCIFYILVIMKATLFAQPQDLARITVQESTGISRDADYAECRVQIASKQFSPETDRLIVLDTETGRRTFCQVLSHSRSVDGATILLRLVFPVTVQAGEHKVYSLQKNDMLSPETDLRMRGKGFDLVIENTFYRADLSKNEEVEPQRHDSGQIREIFVKMGFDQMLTNAEDRIHWAPNFKRPEIEWYTTIAHWESPELYEVRSGPYVIETRRRGPAPQHPEIDLTAVYKFYAGKPWFRFFSRMEMTHDIWLELLRNDEMTMDSIFTHLAFERPDGELVDVAFADRYELLKAKPIDNESPWICFYNAGTGLAYGSIRLKYDNTGQYGEQSPLYQPHTQIGEWLAGIKYWNRRLIHDHLTYVPQGSRYSEENVYLIFRIGDQNKFSTIRSLTTRLKNPLLVKVTYGTDEN